MEHKSEKTILVTGATGKQGGAAARHLASRGWHVRILTRDPNKPEVINLGRLGMEVFKGNIEDKNSVLKAAGGVYGIFSVQALDQGLDAEIRQGKIMADVAKECKVKHFVYNSVGSANQDTGIPHFESKWQIEQYIHSLGLPATIFRPVWFMENFLWPQFRDTILKGTLSMPLKSEKTLQMISVDNIGGFVAEAFEDPQKFIGREIDIAGDELDMSQVAQMLGKIIDREVKYVEMPIEEIRKFSKDMATMYQWFNDVGYQIDISQLHEILPDLMDFETWLHKFGWEHFVREKAAVGFAS